MIRWLEQRLRPREGWGAFLLLMAVVLCTPAAAVAARWVPGDEGWLPLALVALLLGRWLALREDWGWAVWLPVGASLGLLASFSVAAHAVLFLPGGGEAAFDFARRWGTWLQAAFGGGTSDDPDVFLFYAALLCWVAVLLSAWAFYRRQRPLLALLPPVLLSAATIFYSGRGVLWLVAQLGWGVLLLSTGHLTHARRAWEAAGVDYATGLTLDVMVVSWGVTIVVVLLSLFGPVFSVRRVSDWFQRTFEKPSVQVEDTARRLFGGVSSPAGPSGVEEPGASSYLPQSRLLGGRPELLEEVVMRVWTDEPPPMPEGIPVEGSSAPRHYWQGGTFDHYSGRGWATTVQSRQEVRGELPLPAPPAYREVTQRFEFIAPHGDTLYALSQPARVGRPVDAVWRTPDDLARLASEVVSYTVVSYLPTPTAEDLRAVSPLYPAEITDLYLQLPDTVPQRVIELAQAVVADGESVYERTRLLERYLRAYPYALDVEQAPEDQDVADFFLFQVRQGYCDYYATAFVVMARAVGIPARLASGYVGGQYDFGTGAYLVRHADGHSWPEVYFPGWGWVGFEPTGVQGVTELPGEEPLPEGVLPGPVGPPGRVAHFHWWMAGLGVAVLAGLGWAATTVLSRRQRRAAQVITLPLVWGWVGQGGAQVGVHPDPARTPQEYSAALAMELRVRADQVRRWQSRWTELAAQGGAALERLAAFYNAQVYGGPQAAVADEAVVRELWARLRGPLRWFRWLSWLQRVARPMRLPVDKPGR